MDVVGGDPTSPLARRPTAPHMDFCHFLRHPLEATLPQPTRAMDDKTPAFFGIGDRGALTGGVPKDIGKMAVLAAAAAWVITDASLAKFAFSDRGDKLRL